MTDAALLEEIAAEVGTPCYVYDGDRMDAALRRWTDAVGDPAAVSYAVKANSNLAVLARLARHGIDFEVGTHGEYARVRRAGVGPERVVVGGVPKGSAEIRAAVEEGVHLLVLQAEHEFETARRLADPERPVCVGVRVRPGIRAGAHPSLQTGAADAKFGVGPEELPAVWESLADAEGLRPRALAVHLGSGLDAVEPYLRALELLLECADGLAERGAPVAALDLGGGLGVDYAGGPDPEPAELVAAVRERLGDRPVALRFEPGRSVVARAGRLLTRVLYRRERNGRPALVCDGGSSDFSRYALYRSEHRILPLSGELSGAATVDVLGPTCESGDVLGVERSLHGVRPGDLLQVMDTGAYGFVMASNYNSRPRPAEVLADREGWRVVRRRERVEDLWRGEEGA